MSLSPAKWTTFFMTYKYIDISDNDALRHYTKGWEHDSDSSPNSIQANEFINAVGSADIDGVKAAWANHRLGTSERNLVSPAAGLERYTFGGKLNIPLASMPYGLDTYSMNKAIDYAEWVAFFAVNRDMDFASIEGIKPIRASWSGVDQGPYLSQFLMQDVKIGLLEFAQLYDTYAPGQDFMTNSVEFLSVQNGSNGTGVITLKGTPEYIQTARDMASFVHQDKDQQYLNAAWILRSLGVSLDNGLIDLWQDDFVNKQMVTVCELIQRTLRKALQAAWVVKYGLITTGTIMPDSNLLCRPEAYAGILELKPGALTSTASSYLTSDASIIALEAANGNYLLPMAYPEGSPMHPTFPAGHATSAIAVCTLLKILFSDGEMPMPMQIDTATTLVPYAGGDTMTVHGELNKLAMNVADGRTMAGVHFIDDNRAVSLAEAVAEQVFLDAARESRGTGLSCSYTNMAGEVVTLNT